jgi:outer membrane protein TolC
MQELAILKGETIINEAEYMDAIRMYRSLTGLDVIPEQVDESLSEAGVVSETHPALRSAMDRLDTASAATEIKRRGTTARPSLDVFWRGFRGDVTSPKVNALGVGFAVPLGHSPRRNPEVAKAYEKFAEAQSEVLALKRALDLQLHEAKHQLHTINEQLENSDAIMQAATEKYQLDKLAFELGEFSTSEWLRRLSQLKKIEREHELLLIQRGAAVAAYNQAVGESL